MEQVVLSKRMRAVADLVSCGSRVCDVGCDHGFVSIYLVQQQISPHVLAMDVRKGPLQTAQKHVEQYLLEGQIETRLSDGLHNYHIGEADTLVCAGMGGRLMMRILLEQKDKTDSFEELVLQPQSDLEWFRETLQQEGYCITDENIIEEEGKFYPMMRAVRAAETEKEGTSQEQRLANRYGGLLLKSGSGTMRSYLLREKRIYEEILSRLSTEGLEDTGRQKRHREIAELHEDTERALQILQQNQDKEV